MTRKVFMETLERMLSDVSFNDRYDALSYYKEYFDDAGITEDMVVPESVGTPEQIAMRLKKSINSGENITSENINIGGTYNRDNTSGSYNTNQNTGNSYNNSQNAGQYSYNNSQNTAQYEYNKEGQYNNASQYNKKNDERAIKIIVAIIIAAVTFPIWSGILGVIIGIVFGLGGTIIGLGVAGLSLIVVAIVSGYGFATSILLMGIGLILFGIAVLLVVPEVLFCIRFLPWLFKQVVELVHKITGRKEFNVWRNL